MHCQRPPLTYYSYYDTIHTMKQREMVVTNLRIDRDDYLQVKTWAAELGMSINEYVKYLIQSLSQRRALTKNWQAKPRRKYSLWDLGKLAQGLKIKPMGASEEDKIIYGIE